MGTAENIYERRLVSRMRLFWDRVRGDEDVPLSNGFSGRMLDDVWENCLSLKITVTEQKNLYFCDYAGVKLREALGKDLKDKYFSSMDTGGIISKEFIKVLNQSAEKREFVLSQGQFINPKSKVVKYRDCILPFKGLDNKIDLLVVGISWRTF